MVRAANLSRHYLAFEFSVLFVGLPIALYVYRTAMIGRIIPVIVVFGILMTGLLLMDRDFDRRHLGGWNRARQHLTGVFRRLLVLGALLTVVVLVVEPERFLSFPREAWQTWMFVMLFYPLVSAYPQELIFRSFVFHRYGRLFGSGLGMVLASALAFGLAHLFFGNWVAPVLSALGGYLFADTYRRSGTILASSVEHGLWGDLIFTIGIGWYFYGGAIH